MITPNDRFEITGRLFHKATGMLRPGKDDSAASGGHPTFSQRQDAFNEWKQGHGYDDAVNEIHRLTALAALVPELVEALENFEDRTVSLDGINERFCPSCEMNCGEWDGCHDEDCRFGIANIALDKARAALKAQEADDAL